MTIRSRIGEYARSADAAIGEWLDRHEALAMTIVAFVVIPLVLFLAMFAVVGLPVVLLFDAPLGAITRAIAFVAWVWGCVLAFRLCSEEVWS